MYTMPLASNYENSCQTLNNMYFISISNEIKPHHLNNSLLCIHQCNYQDSFRKCDDRYLVRNNVHKKFYSWDHTNRFYKLYIFFDIQRNVYTCNIHMHVRMHMHDLLCIISTAFVYTRYHKYIYMKI